MSMEDVGLGLKSFSDFGSRFHITPGAAKPASQVSSAASAMGVQPTPAASTNPFASIFPTAGNVTYADPGMMQKLQLLQMQQQLAGGNTTLKNLMLLSQIGKNNAMTQKYLGRGGGRKGKANNNGTSPTIPSLKDM